MWKVSIGLLALNGYPRTSGLPCKKFGQMRAAVWMWKYNNHRPNVALGGITAMQRLAMAAKPL